MLERIRKDSVGFRVPYLFLVGYIVDVFAAIGAVKICQFF